MRIAMTRTQLVVDAGGEYRRLDFDGDLRALVRSGVDPRELRVGDIVTEELAAPLRPWKIVAIGLNYLDHIRESNLPRPEEPLVFAKFPSSVTGPNDPIVIDCGLTKEVDWEVELGVVVGPDADVFGYTV